MPSGARAVSTFSCAVSVGIRLNPWNTNPISLARMPASLESGIFESTSVPSATVPEVGRSSAPSICRSVDLPPPVGPWMATIWPSGIVRVTSLSAVIRPRFAS